MRSTVVVLVDDLDGSPAAETVAFAVDGVSYELELSEGHARDLREALAPYVAVARRVGGRRVSRPVSARAGRDLAAIRVWAREHGYTVSDRGRIAEEIVRAYDAAMA